MGWEGPSPPASVILQVDTTWMGWMGVGCDGFPILWAAVTPKKKMAQSGSLPFVCHSFPIQVRNCRQHPWLWGLWNTNCWTAAGALGRRSHRDNCIAVHNWQWSTPRSPLDTQTGTTLTHSWVISDERWGFFGKKKMVWRGKNAPKTA